TTAAAGYHGTKIEEHLDETANIACPVSFHFGEDDPVTPMDQVRAIQDSYASHANADIVAYPGATHNFSLPGNAAFHPEVAATSRAAVLRCFETMRS
ncbi:MAG: dienelactone hydrolase family protein, partial [Alphaproteobacteria bacterium]